MPGKSPLGYTGWNFHHLFPSADRAFEILPERPVRLEVRLSTVPGYALQVGGQLLPCRWSLFSQRLWLRTLKVSVLLSQERGGQPNRSILPANNHPLLQQTEKLYY